MPEDRAPFPDPDWAAHEALAGDLAAALEPDHEPPFCFKADPWLMTEAERGGTAVSAGQARAGRRMCARARGGPGGRAGSFAANPAVVADLDDETGGPPSGG
jgi:hypothetical protein